LRRVACSDRHHAGQVPAEVDTSPVQIHR
jgi:hypothetical protein